MTQDTPAALSLPEEASQPWYDLAWQHKARAHNSFSGDELVSLEFAPADFEAFCQALLSTQAATSAAPQADNLKRILHEIVEDRDALRTALELIAIGEAADPARDASAVLVDRGFWDEELADTHCAATSAAGGATGDTAQAWTEGFEAHRKWTGELQAFQWDHATDEPDGPAMPANPYRAALAAQSPDSGAGPDADFSKRLRNEMHDDRDALRTVLELIAIGESANPASDAANVLVERGYWDAAALAQQGAQNG